MIEDKIRDKDRLEVECCICGARPGRHCTGVYTVMVLPFIHFDR